MKQSNNNLSIVSFQKKSKKLHSESLKNTGNMQKVFDGGGERIIKCVTRDF